MVKCRLALAIACASIGSGFQHGYNTGVLNAPQKVITDWIKNTEHSGVSSEAGVTIMWCIIVSIYCIGGMVGGLLTGIVASKVGRKRGLFLNNLLVIVASILCCVAKQVKLPPLLIIGRLIAGINSGLNAGLCPIYLSEISLTKRRGATGSCYQVWLTASVLLSQIIGLEPLLGNERDWPLLFIFLGVAGILQMAALTMCPESPKYYMDSKGDFEKASEAINKLYNKDEGETAFSQMKAEVEASKAEHIPLKDLFIKKKLRQPLIIVCLVLATQQLSGINAAVNYSTGTFKKAGIDAGQAQLATIGMGAAIFLTTCAVLPLVEKAGRKPLLIYGLIGMAICDTVLLISLYALSGKTLGYIAIAMTYGFVITFSVGLGPVPWLLGSELFTTAARAKATSIAIAGYWFFNFLVTLTFLPLQSILGHAVYIIFIAFQVLACVYIWIFVPETKNKPIEELVKHFE